jgi:decaprenylphospho-beta-D-erythro-pentofuranosid-2-ulose 2-reductase
VNNALDQPQTIVLLGGTSDIGLAIVRALASPNLRTVVLACRRPTEVVIGDLDLTRPDGGTGPDVRVVEFDATDHAAHRDLVTRLAAEHGDLDVVVQAFGQLGRAADGTTELDPVAAAELVDVNTAGAVSSGLAVGEQLRRQGHGTLVVLSSVAGVRTRPSNFVYGATKAGQDAFATGLGHALHGSGASVLTVRPGFVRSSMTAGMPDAPFATDPDAVGAAVAAGLRRRRSVVWVPPVLRGVFGLLVHAPDALWRRFDR